jgi:hypothetical protein
VHHQRQHALTTTLHEVDDMTQMTGPSGALPAPAGADLTAALASLTAAPEALLVIVDEQGRILDVRKAAPAFLAANLVAAAHSQPDQLKGDSACPSDVGPYPWLSD